MSTVSTSQLRAQFAARLAELYGGEVPAYRTLVEVSREVNADTVRKHGADAGRLGDLERVTAERHGAIRVGSPAELARAARVFAAFGMYPVGFYDLRDTSASSIPVVATAFRPVDADELARNPFRVFTSMLTVDDSRFFDDTTRSRLTAFINARRLFGDELLALADKAAASGGLGVDEALALLDRATDAFRLSPEPVDHDWYHHLERISSVAADIGGVPSTHINHLTPRVLDIEELYRRMAARGVEMIERIQGPPSWDGPDVLLRQTSFKALAERRAFRHADGRVAAGSLRVRFGEVEQRGIALTAAGLHRYEQAVAETADRQTGVTDEPTRAHLARQVWEERFPRTEAGLARAGLAFFTYHLAAPPRPIAGKRDLAGLLADGTIVAEPIVYEDFLPKSAAGIFQSNLTGAGTRDDRQAGTRYDIGYLSEIVGTDIHDPLRLYGEQQERSIRTIERELGVEIVPGRSEDHEAGTSAAE